MCIISQNSIWQEQRSKTLSVPCVWTFKDSSPFIKEKDLQAVLRQQQFSCQNPEIKWVDERRMLNSESENC